MANLAVGKTNLKQAQSITVKFSLCKCCHGWQKGIKRHIYNLNASLVIEDIFFRLMGIKYVHWVTMLRPPKILLVLLFT